MPLLPPEPCLFPDDLLTRPLPPAAPADQCWYVLHTRPRTEKCLARRFHRQRVPFYLPLYERTWKSRGRVLTSQLPLFPGYVFIHGDGDVRLAALETNLVANVLPVPDPEQLRADLARVHHLLSSGALVAAEQRLLPGTPVEVVAGPLTGLTGKVLDAARGLRFFIEVRLLQQGVSVEIERWMVRPLAFESGRAGATAALSA